MLASKWVLGMVACVGGAFMMGCASNDKSGPTSSSPPMTTTNANSGASNGAPTEMKTGGNGSFGEHPADAGSKPGSTQNLRIPDLAVLN